jgi:adenylate cyclase
VAPEKVVTRVGESEELMQARAFPIAAKKSAKKERRILGAYGQATSAPYRAPLSAEEKLAGDMLYFSTGLMMFASMLWLAVYWSMGQRFSTTIPLVFQGLCCISMYSFYRTQKLKLFCVMQLTLFLFTPFVLQWMIGNFVNSSGVSLWALLAPVAAIVILGTRESMPWFVAYIFMTALSGMFDYMIAVDMKQVEMKTVAIFFVLNFVTISAMVYLLLWYFSREKTKLKEAVEAQTLLVTTEKELSERLLLNILPAAIATRLKKQESNIADGHADVAVLFADLVNFTHLSEEMAPNETVRMLNEIFSEFDILAERLGVEKIKTIGDAYMAAGGLQHGEEHYVDAIAEMALTMQTFLSHYSSPGREPIQIRIGIATGPVVAGVIGRRKFSYDLWGDTVNVASRMCSEALPGTIQVDAVTYRRLHNRFRFEEAHQIHVKGKGPMHVYDLVGKMDSRNINDAELSRNDKPDTPT